MTRARMIEQNAKEAAAFFERLSHASKRRIAALKAEGQISPQMHAVLSEDSEWRERQRARRHEREAQALHQDTQRRRNYDEWKAAETVRLTPDTSRRRPYASGYALDALPGPHGIDRTTQEMMHDRKARLTYFKALESADPSRIERIIAEASKPFSIWVLEHASGPNAYSGRVDRETAEKIDRRLAERNGHGHRVHLCVQGKIRPVGMTYQRALEIAIGAAVNIETGKIPVDVLAELIHDGF